MCMRCSEEVCVCFRCVGCSLTKRPADGRTIQDGQRMRQLCNICVRLYDNCPMEGCARLKHVAAPLCNSCEQRRALTCIECGRYDQTRGGETVANGPNETVRLCETCLRIKPWRHDVIEDFGYLAKESLCRGVELEVELTRPWGAKARTRSIQFDPLVRDMALRVEGWATLKHDSSLANTGQSGFEIVTAPMSLEQHRKEWFRLLGNTRGLKISERTGLHVHLPRPGPLTTQKMLQFLNDRENWTFERLAIVACRLPNNHCRLSPVVTSKTYNFEMFQRDGDVHHNVMNVRTRNPHNIQHVLNAQSKTFKRNEEGNVVDGGYWVAGGTVEIRMFASTLDYAELMARIEFADALLGFCKDTSIRNVNWLVFKEWVRGVQDNERCVKPYGELLMLLESGKRFETEEEERLEEF